MKLNLKHFDFKTEPQQIKKEILEEFERIKNQPTKNEYDNMFLKTVREKMKTTRLKLTSTHLSTNIKKSWVIESEDFDKNKYAEQVVELIKFHRMTTNRQMNKEIKNFDGASYETIAGVFLKKDMIRDVARRITVNDPFQAKKPRNKKSNYIGIELEFNNNIIGHNVDTIAKALQDAGLGRYVHVGTDSSCGFEVRVLLDDNNFVEPLTKICTVLRGIGFSTDIRCGGHVHLDMRNRDVKKCYANLFKVQQVLRNLLPKDRKYNRFCLKNNSDSFDKHMAGRYSAINTDSYSKYKTLEIRMHQGTLDEKKLISWIKLLLKIVNYDGILEKPIKSLNKAQAPLKIEPELYGELRNRILSRGAR